MAEPKTKEEMLATAKAAQDICDHWDASGAEKTSAYWRISGSVSYWLDRAAGRKPR